MKPVEIDAHCRDIVGALSQIIVGKDDVLHQLLAGILANGHILIEDYPGLAKTLIARLLSEALDLGFKRIQFTPDLLPGDISGRRGSSSAGDRSLPSCCSPTKSTARPRRPNRRSSKRCRRVKLPWRVSR